MGPFFGPALMVLVGACCFVAVFVASEFVVEQLQSRRRRVLATLRLSGKQNMAIPDWELRAFDALVRAGRHPVVGLAARYLGGVVKVSESEMAALRKVGSVAEELCREHITYAKHAGLFGGCLIGLVLFSTSGPVLLLGLAMSAAFGPRLPRLLLFRLADRKVAQCIAELPDMIDMVAMASEAGLSFDSAIGLYVERTEGALRDELARAADAIRTGAMGKEAALLRLSATLDSEPVTRFVTTVIQSHRMGSPLSRELKTLSSDARNAYRAQLEERIAKAPVKMLLPMGALILPAMLLLIIGPVVAGMSSGFSV